MESLLGKLKYFIVNGTHEIHGLADYEESDKLKDMMLRVPDLIGSVVYIEDQYYRITEYSNEDENSLKYKLYFYKLKNITSSYKNKLKFKNALNK